MRSDHPKVNYGKTGILLVNLGTPDSTGWWDIRKYLKEFLSDRRVIEVNPVIWQVILNLFILTFRPSKTAKAYKEILRILESAKKRNLLAGLHNGTAEYANKMIKKGFNLVTVGSDSRYITSGAKSDLEKLKNIKSKDTKGY